MEKGLEKAYYTGGSWDVQDSSRLGVRGKISEGKFHKGMAQVEITEP